MWKIEKINHFFIKEFQIKLAYISKFLYHIAKIRIAKLALPYAQSFWSLGGIENLNPHV